MIQTLQLLLRQLAGCLRSRAELELENFVLRHQIEILRRSAPKRARLVGADRFVFTMLIRLWPRIARSIRIVHPKTLVRWHREGFKMCWRWKSRSPRGRPKTASELRALIRKMCSDNPLWGAPRIHGELLKLGFEISQSTVSKYMPRRPMDPDQSWKTFLRNQMDCTASIDFLVVPTVPFKILFVLVVLSHERRRVAHFGITASPTAEWTALQMTEAFPWETAPRFLIRDRDQSYGQVFRNRLAMMAITDARVASEVCPMFFQLGTQDSLARSFAAAGFAEVRSVRLEVALTYSCEEEALVAAFRGGQVVLAYARLDMATKAAVHDEYLRSIAGYRVGAGYRIRGEFVVVTGTNPAD